MNKQGNPLVAEESRSVSEDRINLTMRLQDLLHAHAYLDRVYREWKSPRVQAALMHTREAIRDLELAQ